MVKEQFWIDELRKQEKKRNFYMLIQKNRLKHTAICFLVVFCLLICRLFYIQVVKSKEYSQKAVQQRMITIPLEMNRGEILDRNNIPFTDRDLTKVIIVYPAYVHDKLATAETVSKASDSSTEEVLSRIQGTLSSVEFAAKSENNEHLKLIESGVIKGVMIVEKKQRYSESSLARHVIGYVSSSDKNGQMGIEKSMNRFLAGAGADSLVAVVDSGKNIIPGLGFRKVEGIKSGESYNIKLTLDYHIQRIVEDVMKKNNINGSAIVMDIKNGDILAMASTPDFNQNNIKDHINSTGNELINKSIWQFDFGSIFKTVVAAAALENHVIDVNEKFTCVGSINIGNSIIKCSTHKNHENMEMSLKEAFALSCNTAFVSIGVRVGTDKILDMAKKLGFGEKQCHMLLEEKSGNLPASSEDGIGNISIGQGKIQVTPLQVTTMMAAIANGGIMHEPALIDELVDDDGVTMKKMERSAAEVVLSYRTANTLKEMLAEVTRSGTGSKANMDALGGSSGKTSSAETGINSGEVVHGWFSGYIPTKSPRYAITVFMYNGRSGGASAAPIFKEIGTRVLEEYNR